MISTYIVACVISGLTLVAFLATGLVMVYAAYHRDYSYMPIHVMLMLTQFAIIAFLNQCCSP